MASGNDPTVAEQPVGCLPYPNQNGDWIQCPTRCANGASLDTLRGNLEQKFQRHPFSTLFSLAGDWRDFHNEQDIMDEIYIYGSVVAVFEVFQDFGYMSTGIFIKYYDADKKYSTVNFDSQAFINTFGAPVKDGTRFV